MTLLQGSSCIWPAAHSPQHSQFVSFHGARTGLLVTTKFNIDSNSQVIRKLKFEVDVALIYVCKAF